LWGITLEALKGETVAQIAKAYRLHANSVDLWKRDFLERGPALFERKEGTGETDRRTA
jgi:hypothetical protein